jgi:phage terminase small subunit
MKTRILTLIALFMLPILGHSQKKLTDKDITGTWKLVIVMEEDNEDNEDDEDYIDREVDESFLGHVISSGVKALVANIMEEIDIRFEFLKNGRLEIYAMGEREDENDNRWFINSKGELIITEEGDQYDEDEIWLMKDDKLVAFKRRGTKLKEKNVYLERIDK